MTDVATVSLKELSYRTIRSFCLNRQLSNETAYFSTTSGNSTSDITSLVKSLVETRWILPIWTVSRKQEDLHVPVAVFSKVEPSAVPLEIFQRGH